MKLENNVFSFIGNRWSWKTMFASIFWYLWPYKQVFSNYELKYKNKEVIRYKDFDLYKKIDFENLDRKLLIFDEWWINANSRNFASKVNKLLSFFIFVSRKFNMDCVFITQDFETFDKNIRRQTNYMFEISNHLPHYIKTTNWKMKNWEKILLLWEFEIKALEILENYKIKYDTRDLSWFEEKLKEFLH
jgi:hypothetical protein